MHSNYFSTNAFTYPTNRVLCMRQYFSRRKKIMCISNSSWKRIMVENYESYRRDEVGVQRKMAAVTNVMHMNVGDGETSYANNSSLQKFVMLRSVSILDEALEDMFREHTEFPKCFKMVDLGCASGPNTFLAMSHVMNKIEDLCRQKNIINDDLLPEFEVFLNDLPDNDFNNLFKSLPENNGRYFVYGLPGSFYGRLFPKNSLHFAYSFYSVHWLSQIPEGLQNINKENIYMAMTSPLEVYEAYANQYKRDFHTFLSSRAEEIVSGGRMVLTFIGRSVENPSTKDDSGSYTLLAKTLLDMVAEGLVKIDDLYSFNMPIYTPYKKEVEASIQSEGSFILDKMEFFRVHWDANNATNDDNQQDTIMFDKHRSGKLVANCVRAFMEPMLSRHFGGSIIDDLFEKYAKKVGKQLSIEKSPAYFNIVVSLIRR